jgi:hypothetical protein
VPNAGWIGVLIAFGELAIGACLAIGFLTPLAALGSLALLFTYVMSGTASVCAFYALFAIVILAMWRTSGWIGVDGLLYGRHQRRDISNGNNVVTTNTVVREETSAPGEVFGATEDGKVPVVSR